MKYLDIPRLTALNSYLQFRRVGERTVICGRVEAFSCKQAGVDKKLAREIESQYREELSTSPDSPMLEATSIGDPHESRTRRLLIDLITTLNASFPDYDFSTVKADNFMKQSDVGTVVAYVNRNLSEVCETDPRFAEELWAAIDETITLNECEAYSYLPDLEDDPLSRGLWSFNYFFVNRALKKILYFTCYAMSEFHARRADADEDYDDEDAAGTFRPDPDEDSDVDETMFEWDDDEEDDVRSGGGRGSGAH